MHSSRVRTGAYVLEGLNSFATTLYFTYLFFHMRDRFGFSNLGNLTLAATNGAVYASIVWWSGRFAQRRGYFTALKLGVATMGVAMVASGLAGSVAAMFGAMVLWTLGISFTWPSLEAVVIEGEPRDRLPRLLGIYNVVWAASSGLATFVGGLMIQRFGPASTFLVPAGIHVIQFLLASWLQREPPGIPHSLPEAPPVEAVASVGERRRSVVPAATFMKMAWVANPFAYVAINGLIPVIPQRAVDLHLSVAAAGVFTSVWLMARTVSFVALWGWTGWHYRFRWLLCGYLMMAASFSVILLGDRLWLLVVAQVGFGFGVGLAYYSSLFYSMDVGETKGEHGGFHEAALGTGICAGPAVGALSLRFFPGSASTSTWAVSALLGVGLVALCFLRYRRTSQPPGGACRVTR